MPDSTPARTTGGVCATPRTGRAAAAAARRPSVVLRVIGINGSTPDVGEFANVLEIIIVADVERAHAVVLAADVDHRLVLFAIADDAHRILAARDAIHVVDQQLVVQDDALVARREMLARAIRNRPLADPAGRSEEHTS